jgi:uracil-DNA glycosylase family 4
VTEEYLPFYPIDSPGMPLPGESFLRMAEALGDEPAVVQRERGQPPRLLSHGKHLERLYYEALYGANFTLAVKLKGRIESTPLLRGHLWRGEHVTGPRPAMVMVVGTWPSQQDAAAGRNFIGPAGTILIQALERVGLGVADYGRWYVVNLVRHQNLDPSTQKVPAAWVKNFRVLLEQELRLVRPSFVLALGSEAAKALIDPSLKVNAAQGRVFDRSVPIHWPEQEEQFHSYRVVPCIHPQYVARSADKLPEFQMTIQRFVDLVLGVESSDREERLDHRVVWTERELSAIVDEVAAEAVPGEAQAIAIDCEWHGDYPTEPGAWLRTIQFSHKPGFAACVVLRRQGGQAAFVPSIGRIASQLRRLLLPEGRSVRLVGHHLRADLPWIVHGLDLRLGEDLIAAFDGPATPEETRTAGGFDTMLAAHSVTEAAAFKLEVLSLNVIGLPRYDGPLQQWKTDYCRQHDLDAEDLEGYGECPDDVLHPYALMDADATRRLFDAYNRDGGLLDVDQYGESSRLPFWNSMRATQGFLEMEMTGLSIDRRQVDRLTDEFMEARSRLVAELKEELHWPAFNPASVQHCRTLLYGSRFSGKLDKVTGEVLDPSPAGAVKLNLRPIKTSGKPARMWDQVVRRGEAHLYNPSTDKEVLGALASRLVGKPGFEQVYKLRNIRFVTQVLISTLRPPAVGEDQLELHDESGQRVYEKGLAACAHRDGRVRTHLFQTKETGRASSARPNLQALSKRREKNYKEILGDRYVAPLRSVIVASPGHVLVEADYVGAELFVMAVQAGDSSMLDHCLRSALPDKDPRHYDLHSNAAIGAFQLTVDDPGHAAILGVNVGDRPPPRKSALELIGQENLRTAAKTIMFGIPYGRGTAAVVRSIEEEGVVISEADAEAIRDQIFTNYRNLPIYLDDCMDRVREPGWMANCFGRKRRFQATGVEGSGELERQACNFGIQSAVADAISQSIHHLYHRPDRRLADGSYRYRHVLQIHDALLFEVRIDDLEWFHDEILPWAMTESVPLYRCDLSGRILDSAPHRMEIDRSVQLRWGVKISVEEGSAHGIPARFCAKPKGDKS